MRNNIIKKIYYRIIRNLRDLQWKAFYKNRVATLKLPTGTSINLLMKGDIARIIFRDQPLLNYGPFFERSTLEKFTTLAKENSTIIDVGANAGLFTILASKTVGPNGKIYAFEPTPSTFSILRENIKVNNCTNAIAVPIALSNCKEKVSMVTPPTTKKGYNDAWNQMQKSQTPNDPVANIEANTLDNFIDENGIKQVDLIKVDIEGAELYFLQGAQKLLTAKNRPIVIFECYEGHCNDFGYRKKDILELFTSYGYKTKEYDEFQYVATPNDQA